MFRGQSVTHAFKLVNIASMVAKLGNICFKQNLCPGSKNFFDLRQKHFLFSRSKLSVTATNVFLVAKLGIISSATMFPSLAWPLSCQTCCTNNQSSSTMGSTIENGIWGALKMFTCDVASFEAFKLGICINICIVFR